MNQLREVVIYNNCRRSDSIDWKVADDSIDHYDDADINDYDDDDSPWLQKIGRYGLAGGTGKVGLRLVTNRRLRWTRSLYQAWTNHQNALLIPSSTKLGPPDHHLPGGRKRSLVSHLVINSSSSTITSLYQAATTNNHLTTDSSYKEGGRTHWFPIFIVVGKLILRLRSFGTLFKIM